MQALGALPELLKPFTVHGTKLRLPADIGDRLRGATTALRWMLDNVHFEGVEYEYQNEEPAASREHVAERPTPSRRYAASSAPGG